MPTFLPKVDDPRKFGIDVSRYQGKISFAKLLSFQTPPVEYVGVRATVSWGYQDSWFPNNWKNFRDRGIPRMAYHVLYPGESASRQMDNLFKVVGDDIGEGPAVLDAELSHNMSKMVISDKVWECASIVKNEWGKYPLIYSRPQFVRDYMQQQSWMALVYWWMAQHTFLGYESPGPVSPTQGIPDENILIHQTSSKGKGAVFGMESIGLDYNRWLGTDDQFNDLFGSGASVTKPSDILMSVSVELRKQADRISQIAGEL